jgi:asparagine synthase (glutamine-hydrolysing)
MQPAEARRPSLPAENATIERMCGIAGLIMLDGAPPDLERLAAMTRAVAHRGPDGEGIDIVGAVGFGHRRLAIVDLSPAGGQPMATADGRLRITFNGEIYNHVELRDELRALGHDFRTRTDTEVILESWRRWGPSCLTRFNGMWAFAMHDRSSDEVFLARDRFGVKPLYYARIGQALAFGSEIRQLLPLLPSVRANRKVLDEFLLAGIDEPHRATFFEGVSKLPAAHSLTIRLEDASLTETRWYSIGERPGLSKADAETAWRECRDRLEDAVRLRLRADVPVGTCLSGGLDSSAVAALAAGPYLAMRGERFRAITAVSEESATDESPFARAVAERAGLDWITVRPTPEDFAASVDDVVRTQEEPFGGPSILMQWFVMRTAREHGIPVMLDGQGGDETLLGYRRYFAAVMLEQLRERGVPGMLRELAACRRNEAQLGTASILVSMAFQGFPQLLYLKHRLRARWMRRVPGMPASMRAEARAMRNVRSLQRLDVESANLPALLRFEDKNSMRFAIETRLPFLDWRSVESSIAMPTGVKLLDGWTKWPLRRSLQGVLPDEITWRRWKVGFDAPTATWLRIHAARMRDTVLSSTLLRDIARPGSLERTYGSMHHGTRWRLFSVAAWEREFSVG